MVRSVRIAAIVLGFAWTGFAGAQPSSPGGASTPSPRYITVTEQGKPPQRCKLLKTWREADGAPAYQVQAVDSGERMTIVGTSPKGAGGNPREMSTRIFRWGRDNKSPAGAPVAPPTAMAFTASPAQPPARKPPAVMPHPAPPTPVVKSQPNRPAPVATSQPARLNSVVKSQPARVDPVAKSQSTQPAPVVKSQPARPAPASFPIVKSQPARPEPTATAAQSTHVSPTSPKPSSASAPAPTRPTAAPYILTNTKPVPSLTPMSTQVIQHLPAPTQADRLPASPSTATSQPRLLPMAAGSASTQKPCNCACTPSGKASCKECNPCNKSSCVCGTPSPLRQPLIGRLLKSNSSRPCPCCTNPSTAVASQPARSVPTQNGKTSTVAAAKPASLSTPQNGGAKGGTPTPVVAKPKTTTEPAKPGDWRQSWGKVEPWKESAKASSVKPMEVSKRVDRAPVQMEEPKRPDPLKAPAHYRDMVMNARLSNSKIPQEKRPSAVAQLREKLAERKRSAGPMPSPHSANEAKMANAPPPNEGLPPSREVTIRDDEPNAFWSPQQQGAPQQNKETRAANNAFDREPTPPPQDVPPASAGISPNGGTTPPPVMPGVMQGPPPRGVALQNAPRPPRAPFTAPPGPSRPMSPDTGVSSAMGNAFTLPGTHRPIPADFGGTPQEPNGFDPRVRMGDGSPPLAYGQPMPGMNRPPMPPGAPMQNMGTRLAMGPQAPMAINPLMNVPPSLPMQSVGMRMAAPMPPSVPMQSVGMSAMPPAASASAHSAGVPQLLTALKDSLRPSEREAAAEQLSELNWRVQPLVVEKLMKSARDDPAATVRAACVHALAHMKAATPPAIALVRELKSDRDPRVRQEAQEALSELGDSGIQQASHK